MQIYEIILILTTMISAIKIVATFIFTALLKLVHIDGERNESHVILAINAIKSHAKYTHSRTHDNNPQGLIIGKWFLARVYNTTISGEHKIVHIDMFTFSDSMMDVFINDNAEDKLVDEIITTKRLLLIRSSTSQWASDGSYTTEHVNYPMAYFIPTNSQRHVMSQIDRSINCVTKRGGIFLLHGPPGTGKSTLAYLLADKYKSPIFIPSITSPRTNPQIILTISCDALIEGKSIILINEVDVIYTTLQKGLPESEETGERFIYNMSKFNDFIDHIAMFVNCIVIMTTNRPPSFFESSFIRPGRAIPIEMNVIAY